MVMRSGSHKGKTTARISAGRPEETGTDSQMGNALSDIAAGNGKEKTFLHEIKDYTKDLFRRLSRQMELPSR